MQVIYTQIALADGTRAVQLMGFFCTQFLDKGKLLPYSSLMSTATLFSIPEIPLMLRLIDP